MDKMTFREAQLLVIGAEAVAGRKTESVELNEMQVFRIGDVAKVTEISLVNPCINICIADGANSYCDIEGFSEKVVDMCVDILREVAYNVYEYHEHV